MPAVTHRRVPSHRARKTLKCAHANHYVRRSGRLVVPGAECQPRDAGPPIPPMAGAYEPALANPVVYRSATEIAVRVARQGSFSARMVDLLAEQAPRALGSQARWDATYSGCDIGIYLHSFSWEQAGGFPNKTQSRSG